MSACLLWCPVMPVESSSVGDVQLREVLEKKFGYPATLDINNITYLEALNDASVYGAQELIIALRTHGRIKIYLEY